MPEISTVDARGLYTKSLAVKYRELTKPSGYFRSFFPAEEKGTKLIAIEVERGTEKVAVDVERGTEGNRNKFSLSTEKMWLPPYYSEYFDATELDLYDKMFGSGTVDDAMVADFVNELAFRLRKLQDKIERAYELNCTQVLETGIVQLNAGTNIDFKRKAGSLVDLGVGNYWTNAVNPFDDIEAGCRFLRQTGKAQGAVFNLIAGSEAKAALYANTVFKDTAELRRVDNLNIRMPQRESVGATTHGEFAAGDYTIRLWTYPEYYDDESGTSTSYKDPKTCILLPEAPNFNLIYAAVPRLITRGGTTKGAYVFDEHMDEWGQKHMFRVRSAGVPIPTAVDQIYTFQAVA